MDEIKRSSFEEVLATTGRLVYTNVGVSMLPLLREGRDVMIIESISRPPRWLDAVLFVRPGVHGRGAYVLHRILRVGRNGRYWIAGDNCTEGETVDRENIIGVLTAVKRGKRTVRVTDLSYRLYVALWCAPYPLRFAALRLSRYCRTTLGRIAYKLGIK